MSRLYFTQIHINLGRFDITVLSKTAILVPNPIRKSHETCIHTNPLYIQPAPDIIITDLSNEKQEECKQTADKFITFVNPLYLNPNENNSNISVQTNSGLCGSANSLPSLEEDIDMAKCIFDSNGCLFDGNSDGKGLGMIHTMN